MVLKSADICASVLNSKNAFALGYLRAKMHLRSGTKENIGRVSGSRHIAHVNARAIVVLQVTFNKKSD
jgi:hypothetical protein